MFNSLKYAKQLIEAGFSREQAEAQMQVMTDLLETKLAMKQDLKDLESSLRSEMTIGFKSVEVNFAKFEKSMTEMELRIQRNMTAIMSALLTAAVAAMKLL